MPAGVTLPRVVDECAAAGTRFPSAIVARRQRHRRCDLRHAGADVGRASPGVPPDGPRSGRRRRRPRRGPLQRHRHVRRLRVGVGVAADVDGGQRHPRRRRGGREGVARRSAPRPGGSASSPPTRDPNGRVRPELHVRLRGAGGRVVSDGTAASSSTAWSTPATWAEPSTPPSSARSRAWCRPTGTRSPRTCARRRARSVNPHLSTYLIPHIQDIPAPSRAWCSSWSASAWPRCR